jgi:8-oxo-dGTP diphosphatase
VLASTPNQFRGVVVDVAELPGDPEQFETRLERSLTAWRAEELKVVWLEVPISRADLIPVAVRQGFDFHHSEPGLAVLTRQLAPDVFVPPHATHYIGAGGVVLNAGGELLVVVERVHRHRNPHYYKLPGGALKPGEHLIDGVQREVREETGIETRFRALMGFRHWHGYRFGKSDIYFVCRLDPLTEEIHRQESEIDVCLWMPVETYLADENVGIFNKGMVVASIEGTGLVPSWFEGYATPETHEIFVPYRSRSTDGQ